MRGYFLIIILFFLFKGSYYTHAQNNNSSGDNSVNIFTNGDDHVTRVSFKKENSAIEGDVYLFPKWVSNGTLLTKTEKKYRLLNVNYNVLNDSFELKASKDSVFILDSNYIGQVNMSGSTFKRYNIEHIKDQFLEVVFENQKVLLLKKYNIIIIKGDFDPLNGESTPDKYHIYQEYYFVQDNIPIKIKLNKKHILSLFQEKSKSIKGYVKKNNLSYKKEKDIISILQFSQGL